MTFNFRYSRSIYETRIQSELPETMMIQIMCRVETADSRNHGRNVSPINTDLSLHPRETNKDSTASYVVPSRKYGRSTFLRAEESALEPHARVDARDTLYHASQCVLLALTATARTNVASKLRHSKDARACAARQGGTRLLGHKIPLMPPYPACPLSSAARCSRRRDP